MTNTPPKRIVAVRKWHDGGESVEEYFETKHDCLAWIKHQPRSAEWTWYVGEFDTDQ